MSSTYKKPYTITNLRRFDGGYIDWHIFAEVTYDIKSIKKPKKIYILPFEPFKKIEVYQNNNMIVEKPTIINIYENNNMILDDNKKTNFKKEFELM